MSGAKRIILLRTVLLIFFGLCCRNGLALDAEVDWNKAERIQQGVDLLRIELAQPRLMKMYLLRIDLDTPGLRFTGTAGIRSGASRCRIFRKGRSAPGESGRGIFCSMRAGMV